MGQLKPGDRVDCRVKASTIVSPYRDFDEVYTFEIVALDKYGYYVYVPPYITIKGTSRADKYQCKALGIDLRFLDCDILFVQTSMIFKIHSVLDGLACSRCKEFYEMAAPNQEDGSFTCWICRTYPYR
jgi:hypothetical protein